MTPFNACERLFADYPLAAEPVDDDGKFHRMVLVAGDSSDARFFTLTRDTEGETAYSLRAWEDEAGADIGPGGCSVPDSLAAALQQGVPLPRDGSLFGTVGSGTVTGMIQVGTHRLPEDFWPRFSVAVPAGTEPGQWPDAVDEPLLGAWFWDGYAAGHIVDLAPAISLTAGTVLAVPAGDIPDAGSYLIAVRSPVSGDKWALPAGVFTYHRALAAGSPIPSMEEALARDPLVDVGPRFCEG